MKKILQGMMALCLGLAALHCEAGELKFDIYKSKQFTIADVQPEINANTPAIMAAKTAFDHGDYEKITIPLKSLKHAIYKKINEKGNYAFTDMAFVAYPGDDNVYITLNVVDEAEAASLPKYRAAPKGHFKDPAHLIKDWRTYETVILPLVFSKKISSDYTRCSEFHCLASFSTPQLKKYEIEFNREVPKHQEALATILMQDANPKNRATAAFLLAHTTNEAQLIQWLIPALDDPDSTVRNNVTRVLMVMAIKNKTITLPIEKFIAMLHSPILTDRNKAFAVLNSLVIQPRYADVIKRECANDLMDNLKLIQPDLHSIAYFLLKSISGQQYGDRDYAAWSQWLGLT